MKGKVELPTTYSDWEIKECIENLTTKAKEYGDAHNAIMEVQCERAGMVWEGAPNAWKSSNSWQIMLVSCPKSEPLPSWL